MEEQNANKNRIIQVLRSFGIEISSIKASVGPTITLYEITPAEGVRISKIRNLEDDIALSLSALGIRIIAPIPGKGTIGIEVPNANPRIVPMSSILASKKFQETTFDLPVALGKTITNEVFMVDLTKAPHMLVAGATGQGKSVGLNAIVTSLLYKKHPSELKFVIIDPKKVEFAIYAPIEKHFEVKGFEDVESGIVKWPLSVIRLRSKDEKRLIELGTHILDAWRGYTDEEAFVFAETDGEPHNTITPIARKVGEIYELDLTLRNNITTEEHPLGLYHPHAEYHNIKKENIGLIEVMGLAVLPSRLKQELETLAEYIVEGKDISENEMIEKHTKWVEKFLPKYDTITKENVMDILKEEVGIVFTKVLEDAGVYKCTEEGRTAFARFLNTL